MLFSIKNPRFANAKIDFDSISTMENSLSSINENVSNSQARAGNEEETQQQSQSQDNTTDDAQVEMEVEVDTLWIGQNSSGPGSTSSIRIPVDSVMYQHDARHTVISKTPGSDSTNVNRRPSPIMNTINKGLLIRPMKDGSNAAILLSSLSYGMNATGGGNGNGGGDQPNPPIVLSDHEMFCQPPVHELNRKVQQTRSYTFLNLAVGHMHHGVIEFLGFSDFKSMANANVVDLSRIVTFRHGGVEFKNQIQGPKLITLFNIPRDDFGKPFGAQTTITDMELVKYVNELGTRMNASFSQYNEAEQVWLFMIGEDGNGSGSGNGSGNGNANGNGNVSGN